MSQHFLLSPAAKTLSLSSGVPHDRSGGGSHVRKGALARYRRQADLPALRRPRCLWGAPAEWFTPIPVQGLLEGFHAHGRHAVRLAQDAAQGLPRGHCDLLQRGEGQIDACPKPRSSHVVQDKFRSSLDFHGTELP
jgi:hypothetical protein